MFGHVNEHTVIDQCENTEDFNDLGKRRMIS